VNAIIDAAISHSRMVLLTLALIAVAGSYAYITIPKEDSPDINIPTLYVSVSHEGISPEDAERLLIKPLEKQLRAIEGVQLVDFGAPLRPELRVPVYRVDGQITDTDRALLEDKVTARASVALLLTDESSKTLRIVFRGSSTTIEDLDRRAYAQPERVARLAIERAVRAALRNASNAMNEALAKR